MVMETPEQIVAGVRKALEFVEPARIHLTTDCGMFSFPRAMARGKLAAMTRAAEMLRRDPGVTPTEGAP
ncbi:hypothetical protein GCM10023215_43660 [Pseudonocardia yuanmonensis]|uniref:Cobalamin-independent methionine synthase MetE C-terminal/archaeal domain-containing protein n=2 Tax=Pseudonocardia yuanmonensis TaxID=1095914 RepID=A0ABP8X6R9_9PSEU